ncbi:MAG: VWA domain-containing protein [Bdellovibrionales bacterium]
MVVFSGESYTRVPLTLDYPVLEQNLAQVTTSKNIKMGTAIGMALANSVSRLKDSTAKSRVVIFLTDGENNSGTIDPETAIDLAKQEGIKVYSIGMGKDGQARLPIVTTNPFGQRVKTYRPIHSKINEALLGRMAQETGGKYFRAITSNALEQVFSEINQLEKTKIESNEYTKYDEKFFSWLVWAIGFYFLGVLLGQSFLRRGP